MDWKHLLASITGTVDQDLLLRNAYLVTEHRLLHHQFTGRLRLSDGERKALAVIGQKLGKQALQAVAKMVQPDTMLGWHRTLVAQKCDGSPPRKAPIAGMTLHPNQVWMMQMARNVTMEEWGLLKPGYYLIHDRDGKFCPAFQQVIAQGGWI